MTTETKKPSELIRDAAYHYIAVASGPVSIMQAEVNEARAFLRYVLEYLDSAEVRLAKLEALNPEVRDVVGVTASGATVHAYGLGPAQRPAVVRTEEELRAAHEPTEETEEP